MEIILGKARGRDKEGEKVNKRFFFIFPLFFSFHKKGRKWKRFIREEEEEEEETRKKGGKIVNM